ncbi:MAG: orotate phosphoribosyltransferase [Bacillota bacterium]
MGPDEVLQLLVDCGAVLRGHFLLTSGRHGDGFVQCSQVMQYPHYAEVLGRELARRIGFEADLVVGPAMGGVILAHEVARALGIRAMFTEKTSEGMKFRRGFALAPGSRVIVVEDVVTTGGSVRRTAEAVEALGGRVVAIGAIVDRSEGEWLRSEPPVPKVALTTVQLRSFQPEECPMCKMGQPLVKPKD